MVFIELNGNSGGFSLVVGEKVFRAGAVLLFVGEILSQGHNRARQRPHHEEETAKYNGKIRHNEIAQAKCQQRGTTTEVLYLAVEISGKLGI